MSIRTTTLAVIAWAAASAACSHSQPYQAVAPVLAQEGVEIEVGGGECSATSKNHAGSLIVDLQLTNATDVPVLVLRDRFRLGTRLAGQNLVLKPAGAGVLTVMPEDTGSLTLVFQRSGGLDCGQPVTLDATDAVQLRGKKVSLPPMRLEPGT